MRTDIDRHPRNLKDVLLADGMRKEFLGGVPKNEARAVKAFVAGNAENALKTRPKGFDADHPDIALLRLRNYTIGRKIKNEEVVGPQGLDTIARLLTCMKPFITYLNSIVMPDEDGEENAEEENEEEENEEEENEEEENEGGDDGEEASSDGEDGDE